MNKLPFYEKVPNDAFPVRILDYPMDWYRFPGHWHEHLEMHFIREGSGIIRLGEKDYEVYPRYCAVSNCNEMHRGIDGRVDYLCIILPPEFLGDNHVIFESVFHDEAVWQYVDEIYRLYKSFSSVNALGIKAQTYLLLQHLVENHTVESLDETVYQNRLKKLSAINKVINYIQRHYAEPLPTKMLAEMVHMSEGHFCAVFKSATGLSANEYVLKERMKKAERLLQSSEMNITEISEICGFRDPNYFSRAFKKYWKKTPKEMRAEKRSEGR